MNMRPPRPQSRSASRGKHLWSPGRLAAVTLAIVSASTFIVSGAGQEHRALLSSDLIAFEQRETAARSRIILPGTPAEVAAIAQRHNLKILRTLGPSGAVLAANSDELTELASDVDVESLTGDVLVTTSMSISNKSTAADQVRAGVAGGLLGLGSVPPVNGSGIRVAVLDSGIAPHPALAGKVVKNISFVTGDPSTDDAYGHGTHVAGIIAGAPTSITSLYNGGIAPGAQLVNVRVLGDDGVGNTSDVIAGIDWVIANKARYNIKLMNLSLGHAVTEPVAFDPLCAAVERASRAGIIVIVAAGNAGKLPDGTPVLGGIASPGNSPFAITVGATNTFGTPSRDDDEVTTYSSRGPTKYDNNAKPDLAAPGNKIVSLEAPNSYIATHYPSEHIAGSGNNAYLRMSGTSMSAPMVTGAAALLLQAQPTMTVAQVKFELQSGSTYMIDAGVYGAGAGNVNFWTSRQVQANSGLLSSLVGLLLDRSGGVSFWDAGQLQNRLYSGSGIRLINLLELPGLLLNPTKLPSGNLNLIGLTNPISLLAPKRILFGDVSY